MRKILRLVWAEIRKGENIDQYLIILLAFLLAILNLFGITNVTWITSITLAVLGMLAIGTLVNRHITEQVIARVSELTANRESHVRAFSNWRVDEIREHLLSAKSSIVIIESWVAEAATLAGYIRDASQRTRNTLKVEIFMLDPEKPFGAQRRAEVEGIVSGNDTIWKQKYLNKFDESIDVMQRHLADAKNIDLKIYKYPTLPEMRLYVIDDADFVFGWFPFKSPSTENVCFYVSKYSKIKESLIAIESLQKQLNEIRSVSQKISNSEI